MCPIFRVLHLYYKIFTKTSSINNINTNVRNRIIFVNNIKYIILDYFDVGLTHKDQKRLVRILRNLKSEGIAIIVLSKNLVFLDQIVNSIIVVKNNELVYNGKMSLLISEHIKLVDEPEILRFISLANKRGANLDLTLDSKELLKDIYRSVY